MRRKPNLLLTMVFGTCLVLGLLAGCGDSQQSSLAVVEDEVITVEDFKDYYRYPTSSFASAQEEFEAKRRILDSMIVTRLLVNEAYDMGLDDLTDVNRVITANLDRFLLDALYETEITDKVEVTEAEIKEFYDNQKYQIRASHILVETEEEAKAILEELKAGADFDELAYNRSMDPSAKRNRGDLGYFTWGSLVEEFERAAFSMESGEVSPPVKSPYGYHIIKVIDRQESGYDEAYGTAKRKIEQQIMNRRRYRLTNEFFESMREKYPIEVDESVANYPLHKREELYPPAIMASIPRNDFDEKQLDKDEKALVLATWPGGFISLGDYIVMSRNAVPPQQRPDFDSYDSVAMVVWELSKLDILAQEARDRGLEESELFKKRVRLVKEYTMADILRNDSIAPPIEPTEEQLRAYYEANGDKFSIPALLHVYEIQVSDEMLARQLANEIKSFQQFKQKAAELTERSGYRVKEGDLGFVERRWYPNIFDAAYDAEKKQVMGPIRTVDKYSVIYPVEATPPRVKDYLEVKEEVEEAVIQEARDSTFEVWLDQHWTDDAVAINEELIWETIDTEVYGSVETEDETNL
ncbi:hypothetical protein GF377_03910 [candidate division GN15 bacterium]|nr:hypothetical protein [candidate division GN15 bacterium]